MREIPIQATQLVEGFERYKQYPYLDAVKISTVGYGHVIRKGEDFSAGLSEEAATELMRKDMLKAVRSVLSLISVPLTDNQYAALLSFTFNLGGGALQRSTLRRKINRGEYEDVPDEFLKWNKAGGRILKGLTRRRTAEAKLWLQ